MQLSRVSRTTIVVVSRMGGKPVVLPESFSREGSRENWLDHFNNASTVSSWSAEQKLLWLKVWMIGRAQMALKKLPNDTKGSSDAAVKALGERFEPQSKHELYLLSQRNYSLLE